MQYEHGFQDFVVRFEKADSGFSLEHFGQRFEGGRSGKKSISCMPRYHAQAFDCLVMVGVGKKNLAAKRSDGTASVRDGVLHRRSDFAKGLAVVRRIYKDRIITETV